MAASTRSAARRRRNPNRDAAWLLDLYLERGPQGFDLVNGDYAIAIWDGRSQQLLLGRDFCGAQPLYFTVLPDGTVFFASEYKALLLAPECDVSLDTEMLQRLQSRKHLLSERTLFSAIRAIPPGTLMAFAGRGRAAATMRMSQPSGPGCICGGGGSGATNLGELSIGDASAR